MAAAPCGRHPRPLRWGWITKMVGERGSPSPSSGIDAVRAGPGRQDLLAHVQRALARSPQLSQLHNDLGVTLSGQGRSDDALVQFLRAIELNRRFADAYQNCGHALTTLARFDEALPRYQNAIAIDPALVEAHGGLGNALAALDRPHEAVAPFRSALALRPDHHKANLGLGRVLLDLSQPHEALAHIDRAIAARPDMAESHVARGRALVDLHRVDEALACFEVAVALDPNRAGSHHDLGLLYVFMGKFADARRAFETAVALAPRSGEFHRSLAEVARFEPGDARLAAMEALAAEMASLGVREQIALGFALGKAHGELDDPERAMHHLLAANALKRRQLAYDEARTLGRLGRIESVFSPELLDARRGSGDPSALPIFIVGMPRSGTTLVEQILASHPHVFGAGEIPEFGRIVESVCEPAGASGAFPEVVPSLGVARLREIGERYVAAPRAIAPAAARVTNKMPGNFRLIGLIHLVLPNARVIHVRRDPVDTCLSCFSKLFRRQPYTYDLGELGRYYGAYASLMAHWRRVLPADAVLDVRYEDVVRDLEGQARRIVAACGLPWDARCLDFHRATRPVRTASANQVRRPLYDSAVGRWRPYEPWLGPLLAELRASGALHEG
jgi:tetratricopeptide (TPR) repeat protein